MRTQTVDYGIDLGTTNSVISKAGVGGSKVIKNRLQRELTPSSVAKTAKGQLLVGQDALDKIDLTPAQGFKRLMGTAHRLSMFDGTEMLPEELSAEVLKELKSAVQLRYDETLTDVVITVPAMFQQPQCEATHRAAELAGLNAVALLQEPIAAATAYISEDPEEGYYMVYDLGGGTFDVSVVRLQDGEMNVVAHGGDNYLGGKDFDRRIFEWAMDQIERRYGPSPDLESGIGKYRLMQACEQAKIALSMRDETIIDLGDLGLGVSSLPVSRQVLEDLIEEHVRRTIVLANERLEQASLDADDIMRVLMVGGSTMVPSVRRRLREDLGIPLSFEQDPMTVVAAGAAIHASSVLRAGKATKSKRPSSTTLELDVFYDPVSPDIETTISGKVAGESSFSGEVRLSRSTGDWDSGWIPLSNGSFACEVSLKNGSSTEFRLSARDLQGNTWSVDPATISIRHGVAAAKPVTTYKYGVALEDGSFGVVLDNNLTLPAHGRMDFQAAKSVPAGSSEELLFYFLEGLSPIAADNIAVGSLAITGANLSRTIKEGQQVEVRIHMDESRRVKARVFVPLYDLEYDVELHSFLEAPPTADLQRSMSELEQAMSDMEPYINDEDTDSAMEIRRSVEQLEAEFERISDGEPGQSEHVVHMLAESKARVRGFEAKYATTAKYDSVQEHIGRAEDMAERFADSMGMATVSDLRKEADRCLRLDDRKGLESVGRRALDVFWGHYVKTEECWIGLVGYLRDERRFASDPIAFDEHLKRADDCLSRRDFEGTRLNGIRAMSYLPDSRAQKNRFWNAGVR